MRWFDLKESRYQKEQRANEEVLSVLKEVKTIKFSVLVAAVAERKRKTPTVLDFEEAMFAVARLVTTGRLIMKDGQISLIGE